MPRAILAFWVLLVATGLFNPQRARGVIRDGNIDSFNLGKGDWIYSMTDATNGLAQHVPSVTNETSLMQFYRASGIRYMIVKAATSDRLFNGCYSFPQFTSNLVATAHANGILIFGYNRSYGSNVVGEIAISDYIFAQGADGFVWDAEAEWESNQPWIGPNGPSKAWQLCSAVRANWPTKFLAHAPFPIISFHTSFPYKEFGYWCDAIMPQIYHFSSSGLKKSMSAGINWSDVNWFNWQNSLKTLPPTNINGTTIYWTNSVKPLAPINDVYGPRGQAPCEGTAAPYPDKDVMEFIDYLSADPNPQTVGGYQGVSFWRADTKGPVQWDYITRATSGKFADQVANIVTDDPNATVTGPWQAVKTFYNATFTGNGSGTDTNSFGTNYLVIGQGSGSSYVEFIPSIKVAGDYDVYQWHPFLANASASVPHVIRCNSGTFTVSANQQTNSGNWSFLGRFNFATGTGGSIRVTDGIEEAGAVASVDGIKLVFAAPTIPPAAPTGLQAAAVSYSRIDLTWTNTATNAAGLIVARSLNLAGPFSTIAALGPSAASYSDLGLTEATTYYYLVRATNFSLVSPDSNIASATTPLVNPLPAVITTQPSSIAVLAGQPASFSVSASGTPPLFYQWRFKGSNIPAATSASYAIASATTATAGSYNVVVTNAYGSSTSAVAQLSLTAVGVFGNNDFGQCVVPAAASNVVSISAGSWHSLALRSDGRVVAWGDNYNNQCDPPASLTNAVLIAAGGYHSLAAREDGTVAAWGANDQGQSAPPPGLRGVLQVAAGVWHSVALLDGGTVTAWGDNSSGQCSVPAGLSNVVAVAAGGNHTLALKKDGAVVAWGENLDENGVFVGQSIVPATVTNAVMIAAGQYHSLAVLSNGLLIAWGDNSEGQGNSEALANPAGSRAAAGGAGHSMALAADGTLRSAGADWDGQCEFPAGLSNLVAVAAGGYHTMVLLDVGLPAPRLFAAVKGSKEFQTRVQTQFRKSYVFESTTNLSASGVWLAISTNSGNGALRILSDTNAAPKARYYRIKRL